jgi:galactokinase
VLAAATLRGLELAPFDMAMLAHRAEFEFVGVPCGIMDQTVSMCAREGHALFLDCRTKQTEHVPLDLGAAGLELLVIDTRAPHRLNDGAYAERRAACEAAAHQLGVTALRDAALDNLDGQRATLEPTAFRRAKHVTTENARVLEAVEHLRSKNPERLGPLLNASHASLRDDFEVTVPELDVAQAAALTAGALGARMVGGGFGGCILVLTKAGTTDTVVEAVVDEFLAHGFTAPLPYAVSTAAGARQVI